MFLSDKDKKEFWQKLFHNFEVGDRVKIIEIWDQSLKKDRIYLIGEEGIIEKKEISYHKKNGQILYNNRTRKFSIPILTFAVRVKKKGRWHFVAQDLELIKDE